MADQDIPLSYFLVMRHLRHTFITFAPLHLSNPSYQTLTGLSVQHVQCVIQVCSPLHVSDLTRTLTILLKLVFVLSF